MNFKDHFSGHAGAYALHRPRYPVELFAYLAAIVPGRRLAWDCATGNGQAALGLAQHFESVIATDASARQIAQAEAHPGISYRTAPAERSGLESGTVDLVTVAQALHWFDFDAFYAEVRRVAAPGGSLAVWVYDLLRVAPGIDAVIRLYHEEIVGPYWPPERKWVDELYETLPFPFEELSNPPFEMRVEWTLADLTGYLDTWSAARRYQKERGEDPLDLIRSELEAEWGKAESVRAIRWPLVLRVGRVG